MRSINLFEQKNVKKAIHDPNKGSTAYYLFSKKCQYSFMVNNVHFKMNNGTSGMPIAYSGNRRDIEAIQNQMIAVQGTIIEMSDYYTDGAHLAITDSKVALEVYNRILAHMDAHFVAMRTDRMYEAPKDDTLRELAEFATAINYKAREADPNVDSDRFQSGFLDRVKSQRAFITFDKEEVTLEKKAAVPKALSKMDSIERYLAMMGE